MEPSDQNQPVSAAPVAQSQPTGGEVPGAFSLFKPSWEAFKKNWGVFVGLYLIPVVPMLLLFIVIGIGGHNTTIDVNTTGASASSQGLSTAGGIMFGVLFLITFVLYAIVYPAMVHTQIQSVRGQKVEFGDAFAVGRHYAVRFIGLAVVLGFLVVFGLLLLIVPGLIVIKRYFLSPFAMVDQDLKIGESMKASQTLTNGRAMAVFGIIGVTILIAVPQIIPIVGAIASLVLTLMYICAPALRYEQLKALGPAAKPAQPAAAPAA